MQIDLDLLFTWGAVAKKFKKNTVVFQENDCALYYYQIFEGSVKMFYTNEDGREYTLGVFCEGNSFGEPPLFIDQMYPGTAIAKTDSIILRLSKEKLFLILAEHPLVQTSFIKLFANRIYNKVIVSKQTISQKPEYRIKSFLDTYKKQNCSSLEKILIPHTRQEIADFTCLRVETVIRTLSVMNKLNIIDIQDHKLYY